MGSKGRLKQPFKGRRGETGMQGKFGEKTLKNFPLGRETKFFLGLLFPQERLVFGELTPRVFQKLPYPRLLF